MGAPVLRLLCHKCCNGPDFGQHGSMVLADIIDRMGLRHGKGDRHLVNTAGNGALRPFQIGDKRHDIEIRKCFCKGDNLCRIGHLREKRRRNETADFDLGNTGFGFCLDPRLLGFGRHHAIHALQTIAWPHFADRYGLGHSCAPKYIHGRARRSACCQAAMSSPIFRLRSIASRPSSSTDFASA